MSNVALMRLVLTLSLTAPSAAVAQVMRVPAGMPLDVRLEQSLSSATARLEDRVDATLATDVVVDGRTVLREGTRLGGIVREAKPAERPAQGGRLTLEFDSIWPEPDTRVDLDARVVSVHEGMDKSESGKHAGIGAAVGGVVGAVFGGKKGALVGVLIGGGGGLASARGEDVELSAGTVLTLDLREPLVVRRY